MKKVNHCDIEKLLTITGEVLRKQEFVLEKKIFNKISPIINYNCENKKKHNEIFVLNIIRNIFIPVAVVTIILLLVFKFFDKETFFYVQVELKLENISANQVEVVGDFTNWEPVRLKKSKSYWYAKFYLKPGTYRYVYIIDKKNYFLEPKRDIIEDDFGNKNSVIVI